MSDINFHETAHSIQLLNAYSDQMWLRYSLTKERKEDSDSYPMVSISLNPTWTDPCGWPQFRMENRAEVDALIARLQQLRDSAFPEQEPQ